MSTLVSVELMWKTPEQLQSSEYITVRPIWSIKSIIGQIPQKNAWVMFNLKITSKTYIYNIIIVILL